MTEMSKKQDPQGLTVDDLRVSYGPITACDSISFNMTKAECVAIVGSNGAGKSSLVEAIAGLIVPERGRVLYGSKEVTDTPAYERARSGLVLVPEGSRLFPQMSVRETLAIAAGHARAGPWNVDAVFELFPELKDRTAALAGNLSGGERQMLAIARGLVLNPEIIMLDEPSAGLAPRLMADVIKAVAQLVGAGLGVLLVEQNVHAARRLAQRVIVMEQGRIKASGGPDLLGDDEELRRTYLGA